MNTLRQVAKGFQGWDLQIQTRPIDKGVTVMASIGGSAVACTYPSSAIERVGKKRLVTRVCKHLIKGLKLRNKK